MTTIGAWHVVALADAPSTPWKNGGGTTQVLLAWPDEVDWCVRISVAEIASDGPFSRYAGVERWFAVLEGAGVRLQVEGTVHVLSAKSEPLHFSGNASVECALIGGATRDLNLMTQGRPARMLRADSHDFSVPAGSLVAVFAPSGASVRAGDEEAVRTGAQTMAWRRMERGASFEATGDGVIAMEIDA